MATPEAGEGPVDRQDRFEIRGRLGSGGMGVVYRAFDRARGLEVALKTLTRSSALDLFRFKREFRSLADIGHPNLVGLHELHTVGDVWFFTMELVEGQSFIQHVRPHEPVPSSGTAPSTPLDEAEATRTVGTGVVPAPQPPPVSGSRLSRQRILAARLELGRLEPALYQLVDGVHALHVLGKLHRDLKPSNVLVEASGRVVLLDFGLISDLSSRSDTTTDAPAAGTPAYMSPEQATAAPLTEASDWYSVGVMLYEALTGRRPFEGPAHDVLAAKLAIDPPPPRHHAPDAPRHLDALCSALLHRDPAARPGADAILAALGAAPSTATLNLTAAAPTFVGRDRELAALRAALADTRASGGVTVFVRGASGMGKSALIRHFLDEVAADPDAIVLEGRCYERESVPYQALDTVIDALTGHLARLDAEGDGAALRAVLPRDIAALARLFPVLRRIPTIDDRALPLHLPPAPAELRQRAFAALRYLLDRLAADHPLVIAIDDLQWGDADSAAFLAELIHHPKAPPVLLVVGHRSEEEAQNPVLAALRARPGSRPDGAVRDVTVGALSDDEAMALLAGVDRDGDPARARALVRDCGGSPFFLTELAVSRDPDAADEAHAPRLDQLLRRHVARLADDARQLLEVCAVAARPVATALALRAAGLDREGAIVATLRAERLVRVRRPRHQPVLQIEPYHDRIRESVVAGLDPARRRAVHLALAEALEAEAVPDHEALVAHWLDAGAPARAARHAVLAATASENAIAFHRAAHFLALAIEHGDATGADRRALEVRRGHALVHAGRLDAAADAFAAAAAGARPDEAVDLRRLEVEQRLRAGQLDENLQSMRELLAGIGFRMPTSQLGAVAALIGQELRLRLRGDTLAPPRPTPPTPAFDRRIQVLWSMSTGLGFVSPVLGRLLHTQLYRDALDSGQPRYLAMAVWSLIAYVASAGGAAARQRSEALYQRGLALARELNDPALEGLMMAGGGMASYLFGQWRVARDRFAEAHRILRDRPFGVRWPLDLVEIYQTASLWNLGDTAALVQIVPLYLRDAQQRGDRLAERGLRSWRSNQTWLVLGRPDEAAAHVDAVVRPRGPGHAFQLMHYYELLARAQIDLYRGDGEAAHARVAATWRDLTRALLLKVQMIRIEAWVLRGRAALAAAATAPDPVPLLRDAERAARRVAGEDAAWAAPLAALLRAGIARARGQADAERAWLERAVDGFAAADMAIFHAVAQRQLGFAVAGDGGARLGGQATAFLRQSGVADPDALARMLAPGSPPRRRLAP